MRPIASGTILSILAVSAAYTQAAAGQPAFEVATVKPSMPRPTGNGRVRVGSFGGPGTRDPERFTCENLPLAGILTRAYGVMDFQISGPGWIADTRFDINAKVPAGTTREQFRLMLQNLMADRFKLAAHHEEKEMQIYELVVAKSGPKLKESAADPPAADAAPARPPGPLKAGGDGFPILPPGIPMLAMFGGHARRQALQESMDQFAAMLSPRLGRPVLNKTGLTGKYDFIVSWMDGAGDSDGPTIFAALQEQLGLRLDSKKGSIDVLVIDHAEKVPSEN